MSVDLDTINNLINSGDNHTIFSLNQTDDIYVTALDQSLVGTNLIWCGEGLNNGSNLYNKYKLNIHSLNLI